MSVIIIHRPSAATKAFVMTFASNQTSPVAAHMMELIDKDSLTECEAAWLVHECQKHMIDIVPA